MSYVSLFSDQRGLLLTDQLVYTETELGEVSGAVEKAAQLSQAIADQQLINEQAKKQGYTDGFEKGRQAALKQSSDELNALRLELHQQYENDLSEHRKVCAELALDIVRKIANNVAPVDWLIAEARTAAESLAGSDDLVLRVHSSQHADVLKNLDEKKHEFSRVVADEHVSPDACRIETRYGIVDVDLNTQIEQVRRLLQSGDANEV